MYHFFSITVVKIVEICMYIQKLIMINYSFFSRVHTTRAAVETFWLKLYHPLYRLYTLTVDVFDFAVESYGIGVWNAQLQLTTCAFPFIFQSLFIQSCVNKLYSEIQNKLFKIQLNKMSSLQKRTVAAQFKKCSVATRCSSVQKMSAFAVF